MHQRRRIVLGQEVPERGTADHVPTGWNFGGGNGRLAGSEQHAAGRHICPDAGAARHNQLRRMKAALDEARRKASRQHP